MSMSRDELNRAFHEAVALEFADIPTQESEIDFTFSEEFTRKMDNLIALQEDGLWRLLGMVRRHIAVIAIIILGVTISACGINQVITNLNKIVREDIREEFYAKVTTVEIACEYQINDVPEEFEKIWLSRSKGSVHSEYANEEGDEIYFWQAALKNIKDIDTDAIRGNISEKDYVRRSSTVIRGLDVEIYENEYLVGAIWIEDGYYMELTYYGCEDIEEVISMVESIGVRDKM